MKIPVMLVLLFSLSLAHAEDPANPHAAGFDLEGSDQHAVALADQVMAAMGGRTHWDKTRFLSWVFFGRRTHFWDRYTGRIRVSQPDKDWTVLMNVHDREGRAFEHGAEITDPEKLTEMLQWGYEVWINDSYWLIMPYKLKDSGVTLKYLGEAQTLESESAHVLQLTFEHVGVTPDNKYHVYVSKTSNLVVQWDFFEKYSDETPKFSTPWSQWQSYGKIKLSGDRGKFKLTQIAVYDQLGDSVFTDPGPVQAAPGMD